MNSERIRMSRNTGIYQMTSMKDDILYARDTSMHAIAVDWLHNTQALISDLSHVASLLGNGHFTGTALRSHCFHTAGFMNVQFR